MNSDRQVYLLNPKELSPETIAVTFAKTSRSPQSFREIAAELTDEQSAQFHEKWVVGYGHASVAEHAVLHIAVENISRLAVESIESNRLASYTEKSSRYQTWSPDAFFVPAELDGHPLRDLYLETCRKLFAAYQESLPLVRGVLLKAEPPREGESESAWDRRIRSQYVDVSRFLLPAASLANVGITANARVLEHAIQKMLSHPLAEVRTIGEEIKQAARREVPTLVKYAEQSPYLVSTSEQLTREAQLISDDGAQPSEWCRLVDYDAEGEVRILAAALFRFGEMPYTEALEVVRRAGLEEQKRLAADLLGQREKFDIPLRELEYTTYTFEVTIDQGAYFELKRHRMMTQTPQPLSTRLGYTIPRRIAEAGYEGAYRSAMDIATRAYERLASFNPHVAGYIVPNGCLRRVLLSMNLRTAFHLCALRSAPNAHFSMRCLALQMAEQIRAVHPILGEYMLLGEEKSWREVAGEYFTGE